MKRLAIITVSVVVLLVGGIAAWRLLPGKADVGDLYRLYADQPGVRVGYIENYRFDDTTKVDVTTLEAIDEQGWAWMQSEFDIPQPEVESGDGRSSVAALPGDKEGQFVFLSYASRSLCIVNAATESQYASILTYYLKQLKQ